MEAHLVSDDLWLEENAIDLLNGEEDGQNQGGMLPVSIGCYGDDEGRDQREQESDEGHHSQNCEGDPDNECVWKSDCPEEQPGQDSIDQADQNLTTKESDKVTIHFPQGCHDFPFELGLPQGNELTPATLYGGGFLEEVKEIDRDQKEAQGISDEAKDFTGATLKPSQTRGEQVIGVFRDPVPSLGFLKVEFAGIDSRCPPGEFTQPSIVAGNFLSEAWLFSELLSCGIFLDVLFEGLPGEVA